MLMYKSIHWFLMLHASMHGSDLMCHTSVVCFVKEISPISLVKEISFCDGNWTHSAVSSSHRMVIKIYQS